MNMKDYVQKAIPALNSPEEVYKLFRGLGYPEGKVLDPSYKRKLSEFDFAKEEKEKVKEIYTVFNYDGKLQIFLVETTILSTPLIRYLAKHF